MSPVRPTFSARFRPTLLLGLLLITAWFYAPTLGFGFIWDDPLWFGRVAAKSLGELVVPSLDYHFYRPGVTLYHRLFVGPNKTFVVPLLHLAHIGWHLLNISLAYAITRRLGLKGWAAAVVAGLTASYPFAYQAVSWTAAQQPMAVAWQNGAWLAYLAARPGQPRRRWAAVLSLSLFLIALTVQEGAVGVAVVPLLMEWVLHGRNMVRGANWSLALIYPLLGLGFGWVWLHIPRLPGYTTWAFEGQTILYLLQGFIYPLLGRPGGYEPGQTLATWTLVALIGLTLCGLLTAAWRAGRGRLALFGLAWALLGVAPAIVGLRYESFVSLAPRLLYYCGPGVALLWTGALWPPDRPGARRAQLVGAPASRPGRCLGAVQARVYVGQIVGAGLLVLILLQSSLMLFGFQKMYAVGVNHLTEMLRATQAGENRFLFVNFPDRYAPRRPPYPMGYWGVTLAPVVVDLGDWAAVISGQRPQTLSRSLPWIDAEARDASPYQVDLRGVITPPDELYHLARQVDAFYLSRYSSDGTFALQWAGAVTAGSTASVAQSASTCQLAVWGQWLCLQATEIERRSRQLVLTLTWQSLAAAQPNDTVFAHLGLSGQPPLAQADGDLWQGILPLSVLRPGDTLREQRIIQLPSAIPPGRFVIRVGVYDRVTGERLFAATPQGDPFPDDAVTVGQFP